MLELVAKLSVSLYGLLIKFMATYIELCITLLITFVCTKDEKGSEHVRNSVNDNFFPNV